jgi:hypothetical protein
MSDSCSSPLRNGATVATMPYTVWGAFNDFKERLEPTAKQKEDASTKHTGVREMTSSTPQMASRGPLPISGVDSVESAGPQTLGIVTLVPPTGRGEMVRVSVPVGELVTPWLCRTLREFVALACE